MKSAYAYIRVSTQKQGATGTSLQEQQSAIADYAVRNELEIIEWFEERETAAKTGRPRFAAMVTALERGKASGVIIHKIDRSARNIRDWADLGDLIDRGIEVHFAHESLDLRSRGGRLSADIQAMVAADYIRNLREEVLKGMYGRLKQGLYPWEAPIGYRNCGAGKPKEIDPVQGPLVRQAFELYATGDYSFEELRVEMDKRGLRGRNGCRVSKNTFTSLLNNPFYYGLIHIARNNRTFEGIHPPLITKQLFDRAQEMLRGSRLSGSKAKNRLLFRRLIRCQQCGLRLIGERQKGRYVYYRCHTKACGVVSLSERAIDAHLSRLFGLLRMRPDEITDVRDIVDLLRDMRTDDKSRRSEALQLRVKQCDARLGRLADLLVEASLDPDTYERKKLEVLNEKRGLRDQLQALTLEPSAGERLRENIELANTAYLQYARGTDAEKRALVETINSNFTGTSNYPVFTLKSPFLELAEWRESQTGAPRRDDSATRVRKILSILGGVSEEEISAAIKERDRKLLRQQRRST